METTVERRAGAVLRGVDGLRRRTRSRVRGVWFPLVVFASITLATVALYRRPFAYPRDGGGFASGPYLTRYHAGLPGARSQLAAYLFWLVAAPLGYLVCATRVAGHSQSA
ncbi:MAG: hypothetical protein ACRD03_10650 [Acidimicrobiales bacterium]